ncbi:GNAT family N-acetyltransferase [Streptomyces fulvoviolaceus]|uniref:GNAT family N-acetyltransferase n=1 Tax=Streptomyces fulvoviolaceus TaxID=285535 RepID=UPI0021C1B4A0|nr:GNAT family N-acetyltransferase [Streptomyces fulvoviolaceus]MCT9078582.1 GNAT family N-acetyltransferase [Streptomyces fulvoviolaceus]
MPRLTSPDVRFHDSFLDAVKEFAATTLDPATLLAQEIEQYGETWREPTEFAAYVAMLRAETERPRRPDWVPMTTLWYVADDTYLGRLAIRHRLNAFLLERGGHIGYDVRPGARRRGHATAMLRDALPECRERGLDRVLVTCDTTNTGSRKVIEANGGEFEDERGGKLRFWIRTGN